MNEIRMRQLINDQIASINYNKINNAEALTARLSVI